MNVRLITVLERPDLGMMKYRIVLETACLRRDNVQLRENAYEEFQNEMEAIKTTGALLVPKSGS